MRNYRVVPQFGLILLSLFALAAVGCGDGYDVAPVSGTITLDGSPLDGASITFDPLGGKNAPGPGSYGKTDASGEYSLKLVTTDEDGAVVGNHRVTITTNADTDEVDDDSGELVGEQVPARYRDGSETFLVPAKGSENANFKIITE